MELSGAASTRSYYRSGGQYERVPLHRASLTSNIVTGEVTVGVVPTLPVQGICLVLGTDLAGCQVWVTPGVVSTPLEVPQAVVQEHPDVFTACVVTRAQARKTEARAGQVLPPGEVRPGSALWGRGR